MADVRQRTEIEGAVPEGSAVAGNPLPVGLDDGTNVVRAQGTAAGLTRVGGVAATDLGKADSAAHTDGDTGVMALAVRNDDLADLAGADGDYVPLQVSQNGALLACPAGNDDYKYAVIDDAVSGDNTIVTAVASRKIRVLAAFMVAAAMACAGVRRI